MFLVLFAIIKLMSAVLAQEVEHRRGKEEVPSSNLGNGLVNNLVTKKF